MHFPNTTGLKKKNPVHSVKQRNKHVIRRWSGDSIGWHHPLLAYSLFVSFKTQLLQSCSMGKSHFTKLSLWLSCLGKKTWKQVHQDSRAQEAVKKISAFSLSLNVMICVGLRVNNMSDGKCKVQIRSIWEKRKRIEHSQAWDSTKMWIHHLLFLS